MEYNNWKPGIFAVIVKKEKENHTRIVEMSAMVKIIRR